MPVLTFPAFLKGDIEEESSNGSTPKRPRIMELKEESVVAVDTPSPATKGTESMVPFRILGGK
jgi:hypothetical protein